MTPPNPRFGGVSTAGRKGREKKMEIITTGIGILSIIGAILTITASNPIVSVF